MPSIPRPLEEGNIEEAEVQKQRIEKLQRERRRVLEENGVEHQPRFFRFVPGGGGGGVYFFMTVPKQDWGLPLWLSCSSPVAQHCLLVAEEGTRSELVPVLGHLVPFAAEAAG